jgi:acetylornithine deacetylase
MDQVTSLDAVALTRSLVDIDSTTRKEREAGLWLAQFLRDRGYIVEPQPVSDGRFNVYAHLGTPPRVVFSTHFDCVPPFFPSREERGLVFGRGSCDAKGILAAQVVAAEQLRATGEKRIGLLFVVGEERGSDGARVAN